MQIFDWGSSSGRDSIVSLLSDEASALLLKGFDWRKESWDNGSSIIVFSEDSILWSLVAGYILLGN